MTPTEITRLLATKGMGWPFYATSAHRPGSRPLPHCWGWPRDGAEWLMVYDGKTNRRWNPLAVEADAAELAAARGLVLAAGTPLAAFCESVAAAIAQETPTDA